MDSGSFHTPKKELPEKNLNGFKVSNIFTKSPILDVWRVQNSHLTLINEKKALGLFETQAFSNNLLSTFSKSEIETLQQVVKYFQSLCS